MRGAAARPHPPTPAAWAPPSPAMRPNAGEGLLAGASRMQASDSPSPAMREKVPSVARGVRVKSSQSVFCLKDGSAVHNCAPHPALDGTSVKRGILRFRAELIGRNPPRNIRVEEHQIGGPAPPKAPAPPARKSGPGPGPPPAQPEQGQEAHVV